MTEIKKIATFLELQRELSLLGEEFHDLERAKVIREEVFKMGTELADVVVWVPPILDWLEDSICFHVYPVRLIGYQACYKDIMGFFRDLPNKQGERIDLHLRPIKQHETCITAYPHQGMVWHMFHFKHRASADEWLEKTLAIMLKIGQEEI